MKKLIILFSVLVLAACSAAAFADSHTGYSGAFTVDNRRGGTGGTGGSGGTGSSWKVVLLVRGLRPPGGTTDPYNYWGAAFDYLNANCPNTIVIAVGTDIFSGSGRTASAGQKLKDLVITYANQGKEVHIVAHSMGGLVTRDCIKGLTLDGRRNAVKTVTMLSTPNCGSHVADIVVSKCGIQPNGSASLWASLGFAMAVDGAGSAQAVWDLQTDEVLKQREWWNDGGRRFNLFGGTSPGSSRMYQAGSNLLYGWPVGSNPNDGMVTNNSALGVCYHYNGGAHTVGTLGNSLTWSYGLNHDQIKSSSSVLGVVAAIIRGDYGGATILNSPMMNAIVSEEPPTTEVILELSSANISNGTTNEIDVPVDQLSPVEFSLTYQTGGPTFALVNPDATVITQSQMQVVAPADAEDGTGRATYSTDTPKLGHWKLRVTGTAADTNTEYGLMVHGTGTLTLSSSTPKVQFADNCVVLAAVSDAGTPVTGATVTADCNNPNGTQTTVSLLDDGAHQDGASNDGVYGGTLTNPIEGVYTASLKATGAWNGNDYTRLEAASFTVSPATATLSGEYSAQGIDEGGNPGFEKLRVNAGLTVQTGTSFRVYGELADSAGNTIATASTERTDLVIGANTVALDFDGDMIRHSGVTSALTLTNVSVSDLSFDPALTVLQAQNVYTFTGFAAPSFVDLTPPEHVFDLAVSDKGASSVTLTWTAPSSEGSAAASYEMRWSNSALTASTWSEGILVSGIPTPTAPGTLQTVTVNGLDAGKYYWFAIQSRDALGNLSDLSNLVVTDLTADYTPGIAEGARSKISGIVTAAFPGRIYVERPDRANGVAVDIAATDVYTPGQTVDVLGDVALENGERKLSTTAILPTGTAVVPRPISLIGRSLGKGEGNGLDNTGLLVRMWGTVTYVGTGFMYIDDGSAVSDGNKLGPGAASVLGRKVLVPAGVTVYPVGSYVAASGISARDLVEGTAVPVLRMRSGDTIAFLSGATIAGTVTQSGGIQSVNQTVECPHNYPNNYNNTWTVTGPTNATRMRVHFTQIALESGYDYVRVQNGAGTTQQTYNSNYTDTWSNWVTGNTIKLNMTSDSSVVYYGFQMDKYEAEVPGGPSQPMSGVTMTLTPGGATTTTGADGTYSFGQLFSGTYTVTPTASGYTFTPANRSITVGVGTTSVGNNFTRN